MYEMVTWDKAITREVVCRYERRSPACDAAIEPEDSVVSTDVGMTDASEILGEEVSSEVSSVEVTLDAFDGDSVDIDIEVETTEPQAAPIELTQRRGSRPRRRIHELEVSVALHSESMFWEGLDGEYGVFLATYDELPIGSRVQLTVHLPGGESFEAPGQVRWVRPASPEGWPGLGVELAQITYPVARMIERFKRYRPSLFHA